MAAKVQVNRKLFSEGCYCRHDQSEHSDGNHAGDQAAGWKSRETSHVQNVHRESQWNSHEVHPPTTKFDRRVEGKDKNGSTELVEIQPNSFDPVPINISRFSHLIITLQSSLGDYLPCTIPVHRVLSEHTQNPTVGQSETVNFAIEGDAELEHVLESLQESLQKTGLNTRQKMRTLRQSQSIDVKYSVSEESVMMDICSGIVLWNHTNVYLLARLLLGNKRLFTSVIPPYSSISCPPLASLLYYLRIQIQPLVSSSEVALVQTTASEIDGDFSRFIYSVLEVSGEKSQSMVYSSSKREIVQEVDEGEVEYLDETYDELKFMMFGIGFFIICRSWVKKSSAQYTLHITPPITVINHLPLPIKYNAHFIDASDIDYNRIRI